MDIFRFIELNLCTFFSDSCIVQLASTCKGMNTLTKQYPCRDIHYGVSIFRVNPLFHKTLFAYKSRIILKFLIDIVQEGACVIVDNTYIHFTPVKQFEVELYNNKGHNVMLKVGKDNVDKQILETKLLKYSLSFAITLYGYVEKPFLRGALQTRFGLVPCVLVDHGGIKQLKGDIDQKMFIRFVFG